MTNTIKTSSRVYIENLWKQFEKSDEYQYAIDDALWGQHAKYFHKVTQPDVSQDVWMKFVTKKLYG